MSFETAAHKAIFDALSGEMTCDVFDHVPDLPQGQPDEDFPYVAMGDMTLIDDSADDVIGAQVTVTLHFWSRYAGGKELRGLMGEAFALLHRADLTPVGFKAVDCLREFSSTAPTDADGKTRHGIQRYRITLHKE